MLTYLTILEFCPWSANSITIRPVIRQKHMYKERCSLDDIQEGREGRREKERDREGEEEGRGGGEREERGDKVKEKEERRERRKHRKTSLKDILVRHLF